MNGEESTPNNSKVIHFVVATVCLGAIICVGTQAYCYLHKVPDMNTPLSGAFLHVTDTLIGALIAMLINTRPQTQQKPADEKPIVVAPVLSEPVEAKITNAPSEPIPTKPQIPTPTPVVPTKP